MKMPDDSKNGQFSLMACVSKTLECYKEDGRLIEIVTGNQEDRTVWEAVSSGAIQISHSARSTEDTVFTEVRTLGILSHSIGHVLNRNGRD